MVKEKLAYEEKILNFWKNNNINEKVLNKIKNGKRFTVVDGPPYPTGEAHLGHLRNWSIKDSVLRFKRLEGYNVYAKDGYDVHGLPVENKVQNKLNLKTVDDLKEYGEENFVRECKKYVDSIIHQMSHLRERLGLSMDRNCYRTDHTDYLSMSWRFFKKAEEKGLLYKDYKTVAWCPHDETTLSDYEIKDSYVTLEDPSIYVKFTLKKNHWESDIPESLLIWTTTPWTLQSNMAIAVNPLFNYSKVHIKLNSKEEILIIGENLIEQVINKLAKENDISIVKVVKSLKGAELEGLKYEHFYINDTPSQKNFLQEEHKHLHSVVLADFVTLGEGEDVFEKLEKKGYKHSNDKNKDLKKENKENIGKSDGTGLVHIAPGHGFDDYELGKKYNLPIFCPVNEKGIFNEGKYKGKYFKDVDEIAIKYLKDKGNILYAKSKSHRYPCCWRCKTPIVYRAADQWWIKRSEIIKEIIKENSNVHWFPSSAKDSFDNLINSAGDWAISRQRFWGIPLPIFEDEDGNYEVFGSKEELEERIGEKLDDIHRDNLKKIEIINKKSGKIMKAVPFIADVWFDSGCASFASHYNEGYSFDEILKEFYPMNWITEGEDQMRGWFSSLFNVGYMVTNKAPYNQVLFYSFVMDKFGQKMSKSLGNGITGNEALENYGADISRYYLLTKNLPYNKLNFDLDEMNEVSSIFNTIENLAKFMDSYLNQYDVKDDSYNVENLNVEDLWILYKLNKSIESFVYNMNHYKINMAILEMENFILKDLSKTYLKIVKERTEQRDENLLIIFSQILRKILIVLSPIIPFKTEDIYSKLNLINKKESVLLENFPFVDDFLINYGEKKDIKNNFELSQEIITAVLNSREKAKIGLRWPLSKIDIIGEGSEEKLKPYEKLIKQLTNILEINYDFKDLELNYIIKPNFTGLKNDFENISDVIKIINLNKFYISEALKEGKTLGVYDNIEIDFNKHIIKELELNEDLLSSDFKSGFVILHTKQDEILLESGYLREIIRRIQLQRKEMKLDRDDKINLSFEGSDDYFLTLSNNWDSYICKKVGAEGIFKKIEEANINDEIEIRGKLLKISISKLQ
jgi:isoleucyl-tRNA synthetase